ncbi:MAG: hypothetical protein EBU81_09825, partial [Proteobacteria bacterium]|nr:hypothetical protein [Pseudomonadota bacterium]
MFQLVDLLEHMLLDGVGQGDIVGCEDELHATPKVADVFRDFNPPFESSPNHPLSRPPDTRSPGSTGRFHPGRCLPLEPS